MHRIHKLTHKIKLMLKKVSALAQDQTLSEQQNMSTKLIDGRFPFHFTIYKEKPETIFFAAASTNNLARPDIHFFLSLFVTWTTGPVHRSAATIDTVEEAPDQYRNSL